MQDPTRPAAKPVIDSGPRGELLGQVLADAIAWREPSGACEDCDVSPAGLCDPHAEDLDRCDAYAALGRELGIETGR